MYEAPPAIRGRPVELFEFELKVDREQILRLDFRHGVLTTSISVCKRWQRVCVSGACLDSSGQNFLTCVNGFAVARRSRGERDQPPCDSTTLRQESESFALFARRQAFIS